MADTNMNIALSDLNNSNNSNYSFKTLTQYDKRFDGMFDHIKNKGYGCSYFSVLSCLRFLQGYPSDVDTHEKNIIDAMTITCLLNVNSGLGFEDLITGCTNYDPKKIVGTSVELIVNNVIGPNEMFPKLVHQEEKYAVMFLKNEKYFVVLVDSDGFYLRDCHLDVQHNFKTLDEIFGHLSSSYQFTQMINIEGFQIEEYSSVEFLIFDQQFECDIMDITSLLEGQPDPTKFSDNFSDPANDKIATNITTNISATLLALPPVSKEELLNGDMLNIPEKTLFSKKDIDYLQQLNNELSQGSNKKPNIKLEDDIAKPTVKPAEVNSDLIGLSDDEQLILLSLQRELDEFDNDQFVTSLLMDSVSPDDMVDFK